MATILVVEDSQPDRALLTAILESADHRVVQAGDGQDALTKLRSEHFDLVITDIVMPGMDGYAFVGQLRSDPALAATPVVFWTASFDQPEIDTLAQACGVRHILCKPTEREVVISITHAALSEPSAAAAKSEIDHAYVQLLLAKLESATKALEGRPVDRLARPILVVEDNPMDLDFLLQAFEENNVLNPLRVCRDGEEALQFIAAHATPDDPDLPLLVLLDLRLPKVDGIDVLRQARQHPVWKKVPFIVVTTSRENVDISRAYELGANSFIVKPVNFAAFADTVKNIKTFWLLANEPPFPGR